MSRVIGFVYRYASYFTTLLSLMSVVVFLAGHMTFSCAATEKRCRVAFGQLAMAPILSVAEGSKFCGRPLGRASLFVRL
jgi:hypothetical protein